MKIQDAIARQPEPLRSAVAKLFAKFPEDEPVMLQTFRPGTVYIKENEPNTTVYFILSGITSVSWLQPGQGQFFTTTDRTFSIVGELAALADANYYTASMRAESMLYTFAIRKESFLIWMQRDEELYRNLVQDNLNMLMKQARLSRNASGQDNYDRMLDFLLWNYQLGATRKQNYVIIRKTREQMAEDLGRISARTVNRYIAAFEKQELLTMARGKIKITKSQYERMKEIAKERIF